MGSQLKHIEIVVQQLNNFSHENESIGHFLDESAKVFQAFSVTDETFLMATLSGCIEYKPLLDVVVNAFYIRDGKHCLLSERNLYVVVCYLATFKLEELGLQHFRRIIKSVDAAKICKFLRFFFNVTNLCTWIKDEWSQIYDSVFVKDNWIEPLLRWQPKVQQLIDLLDVKLNKYTLTTSKITEPKEFNLTVPNPRAILIPELIPQKEKRKPFHQIIPVQKFHRSIDNFISDIFINFSRDNAEFQTVPENIYKPPRLKQHLEGIKLKNRRKAEELLLEANVNQFSCAAQTSGRNSPVISEIQNFTARFQAQKIKGEIDNVPVKLNATAILREGVLYQRKVEQELNRIEHLLRGARDPSEFLEWQKHMHGKDLDQKLTKAACRRLQGQLSYEEAILARQNYVQENQKKAEQKREEEAEMSHQRAERHQQTRKEKEKKVQQVVDGRKNVKHARMKLQKTKQQIGKWRETRGRMLYYSAKSQSVFLGKSEQTTHHVDASLCQSQSPIYVQEVSEESQELLLQTLKEEEERFKKRYELIQQIRAIEYLPLLKNKFVDLTQIPKHGVLGEMSLVELQERLALLKEAQKKAEEEKRDLIIWRKHAKEQLLLDKLEQISMFREQFGRAAALKQEERKIKAPLREHILKDEQVLDLQKKMVERSMERKMQTENLKTTSLKYNEESIRFWRSNKKSQQEDHWKKLEKSRQQHFKMLQHSFMSREMDQKVITNEAVRTGTNACILRS
ncbi:cilia- and flagella-associated protein 99 isoform X2 [Rhineura floridana]|nr:cilia- and flagella-associated protein 99 isoform X2 [Rhineura floridana]XP_061485761.1 cilia- and flagella-associated protein 99 isoform X2 [Rhineura floridana]XP_061485762.1 cilia- and flagella-associated protein 99 isoform X2 [Rhineura floridana]